VSGYDDLQVGVLVAVVLGFMAAIAFENGNPATLRSRKVVRGKYMMTSQCVAASKLSTSFLAPKVDLWASP
jgi:hypothetical protein